MDNVPEVRVISKMKTANLAMSLIESLSTLLSISAPIIALYIWVSLLRNIKIKSCSNS